MYIKTSDQEKLKLGIGNYSCNWGVHICGLYENDKERDEIIFGFLGQGFNTGDFLIHCASERSAEDFYRDLGESCPACKHKMHDPDQITITTAKELYYPNGKLDLYQMDKALDEIFTKTQVNGKRNVRVTAEMAWALEAILGIDQLMAYEARLNYFITGKPWVSICLYNVNMFNGATIMNVLQTHPYVINGGVITQNPYYVHPDKWLAEHAPQYLTKN